MKLMTGYILVLITATNLLAVPRFALMEDVSCGSCHSYQGGGGSRTSYGKEYERESLAMRNIAYPWMKEESESSVYFGLDTRYQMIAQSEEDFRQFPMQFALYTGAEFGSLVSHAEVVRISDEFRFSGGLRYEGLPLESWVSVAKEMPVLGYRIDDHSVFTRGGNLSRVGLEREGMPFTPFVKPPVMFELGSEPVMGLTLSVMAGSPFIAPDVLDAAIFSAFKVNYRYSGDLFTAQIGLGVLDENQNIRANVMTWGLSSYGVVWLGEVSQIEAWPSQELSNYAALNQLSYRLIQGIDIVGRYEFFDPDTDLLTGGIERTSIGLEFFPIPGVELKVSYRRSQLDLQDTSPEPESQILSQIHIYL